MRKPPADHTSGTSAPRELRFVPIAFARSPYTERYGAPHQASVIRGTREARESEGRIELADEIPSETLLHLEGFDYVWAIYVFHLNRGYKPLVRPPRTPDVAHGVFATRAPHRPNAIGLSALRIARVEPRAVVVSGLDLLDGTPILDLKPYLPYADAFPDARAGWVDDAIRAGSAPPSSEPATATANVRDEKDETDEWDER
jgi:tRNA-Thr(GGU) m(6)t(6)A37 methyltransferase TsaA